MGVYSPECPPSGSGTAIDCHCTASLPHARPPQLTAANSPISPVPTASDCRHLASLPIQMDKLWEQVRPDYY